MDKLTEKQIEEIIKRLTTENIGIIWFSGSGSYESMNPVDIANILRQIGGGQDRESYS